MASKLKTRKKKYHPPEQESHAESNIDIHKTNEEQVKNNIKTYAQIKSSSTKTFDENEIFHKAIESAKKHNIKMKAGRKDRGYGNCVFEAVINNINDRSCYIDNLRQSPNWYRHIWMKEMMERLILEIVP